MKHIWQSGNRNWLIFGLLSILIIGGGRAFMRQPAIAASVIGAGDIPANNPYLLGCLPRPLVLPEGKIVSTEEMSILADIAARSVVALNGIHPMSLDPDKMAIRNAVYAAQADALYDFVQAHPDSGITPSIAEQLAGYYKREGRYSIALPLWAFVWEDTKNEQDPQTRWIADSALVEYLHLLASLGRVEQLTQLFEETRQRIFSSTHSVLYLRYLEAWQHMQINPGKSFRCGTLALLNAAKALHDTNEFGAVLAKIKSPATGFSIKALFALSEELKLGFVPVKWGDNKIISFPSVVHWKENHYAAILSKVGDRYLVVDPTFGDEVLLTEDAIFMEASGTFLVPQQEAAKGWISITPEEQAQTFGKGYANFLGDGDDAPTCDGGSSSGGNQCGTCAGLTSAQGMPVWWVSEPWINLWLKDEPLSYQPAIGGEIKVSLLYKQRKVDGIGEGDGYASTLGGGWVFPWSGGMEASWLLSYGTANGYVKLYSSDGTYKKFKFNGQEISPPDFYDFSTVEIVRNGSNVVIGLIRHLKDGSKETYDYYPGRYTFYLTSKSDPHNYTIQVEYANTAASGTDAIVKRVIDPDGNALVFTYDQSGGNTNRVSKITDATGRSAQFIYQDTSGVGYYDLHQIIDAAGITNSINYDSYHQATSLLTPYGTTSFDSFTDRNNVAHHEVRYLTVTQPNGSKLRWLFDSSSYGTSYDPFPNGYTVPAVTSNTFDQGVYDRNSYHWDARNFDNLSQATKDDPTAFTAAELLAARFRHWLGTSSDGAIGAIDTLALERPASADGTTEPQSTWYDYPSKPDTGSHGSQNLPSTTARVMPDGTTWYLQETRNTLGRVTQSVEHWFVGATDYTRTNTYTYDSNGIDLLTHTDPNGAVVEGYAYDSSHPGLPVRITNAVSEVTYLAYDAYHRLLSRQTPADLRTTNTYDGTTKYLSKTVDYFGTTPFRTNLYTYQTNYLVSHTDPLGLTRTFEYDNLRRLLKVNYPDSTYEQTGYAISSAYPSSTGGLLLLDRTSQRDRLGKMTYFQWTPNRQIFAVTDPLSVVTAYGYCICGALDYVTNAYGTALAEVTHYGYDNQGKVLDIYYPDSTHDWKTYDVMGRLKTTVDAISTNTYFYDNLNRLTTVTNATGVIRSTEYDPDNRVTASTDANGVQIQSTYDNLGRIRTRTAPDSGVEAYGYTANVTGPSSFTNQISKVWQYAYDAAGRKTNEIGVGVFTNRFTYDAGGNLKTLADGKSQTTTWKYDLYGRLTNKLDQASASILTYQYDANSRLTNRSSSAFGSTKYGYDDRGSLTNVAYPSGTPSVTNCFDALGRLTNMVDGMGPTKYAYYPGGLLWTEDSPWASDVMTNRYHSSVRGLRVGFDLQQPTGLWSQTNAYDAGKRLTVITAKSGIFNYSYRGAGNLWTNLALPNTAVITNSFETVGRLVGTTLRQSGGTVTNRHTYTYNVAGQRTVMARTDASTVTYSYDNIGEVSKALGSGGVSTENLGYGYDAAFNLSKKTNGSVATFSVDSRNQLTSDGTYPYAYDANGNLTNKNTGYWVYSYDAENRLVSVQNASYYKTTFQYDGKSRLRKRVEWSGWNGSYFASTNAVNYLYDGMRVIQERDDSNTPLVSYTRGLDLSGSIEGAGGIAGLLSRSHSYSAGSWGTHSFYHADGGGNVTMMLNSSQSAVAIYKYDPYGNTLTSSGTLASANTYRFSSKEIHANSGMYYYGYRFYDPAPQRWLNRDPLGEVGFELARGGLQSVLGDGPNIFIYTRNNPIAGIDPYGLKYGNPVTGPGGRTYPGFPWDPPSPPCPGSPDPCAAKCALAASLGAASLAACVGPQTPFLCMAAVSAYYLASEACVTCLKANKSI